MKAKVKEVIERLLKYDMNDIVEIKDNYLLVHRQCRFIEISPKEEFLMKLYGYSTGRSDDKRVVMKSDYLQFVAEYKNDFKK